MDRDVRRVRRTHPRARLADQDARSAVARDRVAGAPVLREAASSTAMTARDVLRNAARRGAHWVDLQYSLTIQGLHDVAPLARGELLDVGCGEKPYESIFRPFVTRYV